MAIRTYKVTLDSKNTIAPEPVFLRQGDKTGAVVIDATLMDNGSPVSLSGLTPMFKANTADGQAVIADSTGFNIVNESAGEFTYQVPNALSAVPGKITTAYFSFSDASGSESTFDVAFIIKKAVDITQPQADDYIAIIDGTIQSLQQKIDEMNTDVQTILNNYNQGDFYNKSETDSKDGTTLLSAKAYTDNSLSGIVSLPETFANLAAIKAKYPSGKNGLMVAADNGHKYIWDGSSWADAGVYQAVGIADNTVTTQQVTNLNYTRVQNTFANPAGATTYSKEDTLAIDRYNVVLNKTGSSDGGIIIPVDMSDAGSPTVLSPLQIAVTYRCLNALFTGTIDLFASADTTLPGEPLASGPTTNGVLSATINADAFVAAGLNKNKTFNLIVVAHGGTGMLNVTSTLVGMSDQSEPLAKRIESLPDIDRVTGHGSGIMPQYAGNNMLAFREATFMGDNTSRVIFDDDGQGFTISKNGTGNFTSLGIPVRWDTPIDDNNSIFITADFEITDASNYTKIELWAAKPDGGLYAKELVTTSEKSGSLTYAVRKPLADAWQLNSAKYWRAVIVLYGTKATVHVTNFSATYVNVAMNQNDLAQSTLTSDQMLLGKSLGIGQLSNHGAILWNEGAPNASMTYDTAMSVFNYAATSASTKTGKGFTIMLQPGLIDQFPDHFYVNLTAKVSAQLINMYITNTNNGLGPLVGDVTSSTQYQSVSLRVSTRAIRAFLGADLSKGFGLLFAFHGAGAVTGAVKDLSITEGPVYRTIPDSIDNLMQVQSGAVRTYAGCPDANGQATAHAGLESIMLNTNLNGRQKLVNFSFTATVEETLHLSAGTLDQHSLQVNPRHLTDANVKKGYNFFDYSKSDYYLNDGEKLFINLAANTSSYPAVSGEDYGYYIQDGTHPIDQDGYSGDAFAADTAIYPVYAELVSAPLPVTDLSGVESEIKAIRTSHAPTILRDDGALLRMRVKADNSTYFEPVIPEKIAIFGNSLTKERGDIGMAASDKDHDWYALFVAKAKTYTPGLTVNERTNIAAWAQSTSSADRKAYFDSTIKPMLSDDTGMVIYQISDNANSDERRATFQADLTTLIKDTKTVCPNATILVIAAWFIDPVFFAQVTQGVADGGGVLVDITPYKDNPANKSKVGATRTGIDGTKWQITNPGEALHPNDRGMQLIADAVFSTLGVE